MIRAIALLNILVPAIAFSASGNIALAKVRPLSTSNHGTSGTTHIPRLEPGLRYKLEIGQELSANLAQLSFSNPMDWIKLSIPVSTPEAVAAPLKQSTATSVSNLFGEFIAQTSNKLVNYIRKVITATLVVASSLTSPVAGMKRMVKPLAATAAVVVSVIATPLAARAGVLRKYSKLTPTQKLATTPLFFLCNSNGQPFLQEDLQTGNPEQRIIVYFMSSEDAYDYLDEMVQASGGGGEFRVMATSMEKVECLLRYILCVCKFIYIIYMYILTI